MSEPESAWAGRAAPGLVAAFEAGRLRLAPAGLTVALVQVRWREPVGTPWIEPACFRWLVRLLGAGRRSRLPASVRVTVRVTEGPDGRPRVGVVTRPGGARAPECRFGADGADGGKHSPDSPDGPDGERFAAPASSDGPG